MKIRWREHEFILVTGIALVLLINYLLDIHRTWGAFPLGAQITMNNYAFYLHEKGDSGVLQAFVQNHVPFNLFKNMILPSVGMGLLAYLGYLWISFYTVPRLLFPKKIAAGTSMISATAMKISLQGMAAKMLRRSVGFVLQLIVLILILGTALTAAIYLTHQWQFNYPEFSLFANKSPNSQIDVLGDFFIPAVLIALYGLYVGLREFTIGTIERSGTKRAFRTMLTNQISLMVLLFFGVFSFLSVFDLVHEGHFGLYYFAWVSPLFLLYLRNTYWLFPRLDKISFWRSSFILPWLLSCLICSLPFLLYLADRSQPISFFVSYLFIQMVITTPVCWLLYQRRKDEILLLKGSQQEIAKINTKLQFLRSQINPHFLFNVLNTLYGTALQENAARTAGGIQRLGDMMRFMLHDNNLDQIDMNKEIDYLRNYIALQKLRIQAADDILIQDDIDARSCHHRIAPMLLIPLVENAFKHGISLKEKSWIKIALHCDEKNIFFSVRNSMHKKTEDDPENQRSGTGWKNVMERLKLIYPGRFQVTVNGDGKEFFVELSIQPATE